MYFTLTQTASITQWQDFIDGTLREIGRILRPQGYCILEVGDVIHRGQPVNLDEVISRSCIRKAAPLQMEAILIQKQPFTKLAHCFQITNNRKGTNTQRLLIMKKTCHA